MKSENEIRVACLRGLLEQEIEFKDRLLKHYAGREVKDQMAELIGALVMSSDDLQTALRNAINRSMSVVPDGVKIAGIREKKMNTKQDKITKCPDCGGKLMYYHSPGITRIVCKKKCQGWKVLQEIDRGENKKCLKIMTVPQSLQ